MTRTITTATAARLAGVTTAAIRTWCRTGAIAAAKTSGRWIVQLSSLLHRLNAGLHRPLDRLRKGETTAVRTGRAARIRVGHHMSPARRYAVLNATVARANAGLVTTAGYLRDVIGADEDFVARYASPFGKAVAKAYREQHNGAEPPKNGLARRGRILLPVFAYGVDELAVLEKGALAYKRTAELLAA